MTPDCPGCGAWITKAVSYTHLTLPENVIRRRHCEYCGHRFYTKQYHEEVVEVKWVPVKNKKHTIPKVTKVLPTKFKGQLDAPRAVVQKKVS